MRFCCWEMAMAVARLLIGQMPPATEKVWGCCEWDMKIVGKLSLTLLRRERTICSWKGV